MTPQHDRRIGIVPKGKETAVRRNILRWAAVHLRDFPWRHRLGEPYAILVAEILLKRTTATAATDVYSGFIADFPDLPTLAVATSQGLHGHLVRVGLQKQRATAFKAMARYLLDNACGEIPADLQSLRRVPGIGEYSARAVLSYGFNFPVAPVDSNVFRILGRYRQDSLGLHPTSQAIQDMADRTLPEKRHQVFNLGLLDLGALVCRPVHPVCSKCPLSRSCDYRAKL